MMKDILSVFSLPLWLIYLLSGLFPRDKTLVLFGVHTAALSGNVKALFLEESDPRFRKIFLSDDPEHIRFLRAQGGEAYRRKSLRGIWYALRGGTYIYSGFPSDIGFWLSKGAGYINLWHGTPLKHIERDVRKGRYGVKNRYRYLFRIFKPHLVTPPDLLLVSSEYERRCFGSAFGIPEQAMFKAYPPRLSGLLRQKERTLRKRTLLYAPTWRDDHSFRLSDYIDLRSFNDFLKRTDLFFLVKLHPSDRNAAEESDEFSHITFVAPQEDIYDYLPAVSLLVSDYSSMIFEAFYLNKPVVLFCPDAEDYREKSRDFYLDPCRELPVSITRTQKELERALRDAFSGTQANMSLPEALFRPYPPQEALLSKLLERLHGEV